jgi:hypothetical protein
MLPLIAHDKDSGFYSKFLQRITSLCVAEYKTKRVLHILESTSRNYRFGKRISVYGRFLSVKIQQKLQQIKTKRRNKMEQTTETKFEFKDGNAEPTGKQLSLYGRKIAEKSTGVESSSITQQQVSDLIGELKGKLNQESDTFTLKSPESIATFSQFHLVGRLSAEINSITSMSAISEAISSL